MTWTRSARVDNLSKAPCPQKTALELKKTTWTANFGYDYQKEIAGSEEWVPLKSHSKNFEGRYPSN